MTEQLILHEYAESGNCYKVRLTATLAGKPMDRREYDIMKGETRTPQFLASVNSNGRIPVLQVGKRFIPESNAACYYIADGSHLIPTDPFNHADMLRWMFWEQYSHEPNIATLKFWMRTLGPDKLSDLQRAQMPGKRTAGNAALKLMDDHLKDRDWFVGDSISLADICLFAYTHLAGEAEFDLSRYPNVVAWVERVEATPRYVAMIPE
ncbi:MAG: glutathione S-transferase family protein [Sphingomonas sp.]|nr:glutathione S-transferase family protein [Sphingomonas sp.]